MGYLYVFLFSCAVYITVVSSSKYIPQNKICGPSQLTNSEGTLISPNYPSTYPSYISCTWVIISPPRTVLTISVRDFDIEEDANCNRSPCCQHNWLSLPREGGRGMKQFCGHNKTLNTVSVSQQFTYIKFHTSKVVTNGRGFRIAYTIDKEQHASCKINEFSCPNGKCVPQVLKTLPMSLICETDICMEHNMVPCGAREPRCFNNVTQRCNGIKDCASGQDEMNCGKCGPDQLPCHSGIGCYNQKQVCDKKADCADYTDELNCHFCGEGQALCSLAVGRCFTPGIELCDRKLDCPYGEDEVNCDPNCVGKIACASGQGCYSPAQRCNSMKNCHDNSDEADCPKELCILMQDKFECDNGRCISYQRWCNGEDDCGDNSDEQSCIKTSIITAAIMGSLICGLLLVIAVGCMCRLYSLRLAATSSYRLRSEELSNHGGDRLRVSLPPLEEFYHREPPPAYTVAVNDCQPRVCSQGRTGRIFSTSQEDHHIPRHGRRSARRHSGSRRRSQRPERTRPRGLPYLELPPSHTPMPQTDNMAGESKCAASVPELPISTISGEQREVLAPLEMYDTCFLDLCPETDVVVESSSTTSTSLSPSRESVTSSTSLLSYLSSNDDTQLLVPPS